MLPNRIVLISLLGSLAAGTMNASSLIAYISAPGQTSSIVAGASTETFNDSAWLAGVTSYNSVLGVYTAISPNSSGQTVTRIPVIAADQYGGADGSDYMYAGQRQDGDATAVDLHLTNPANYFGFWWSAGDATNVISIYDQGVFVAQFTTSDITTLLSNPTVTALNGTTYSSSSYYGNPTTAFLGQDSSEPFGYVSLVANGFQFDEVVFSNLGGSGFENDNNSVYSGALNIPKDYSSFVEVSDLPFSSVPEPGTLGLTGGVLIAVLITSRKRFFGRS